MYDDKNKLNKNFFKEVFSHHYNAPDLKITKLNVKCLNESDCVQHYPTSTVTDLLINWESQKSSSRKGSNAESNQTSSPTASIEVASSSASPRDSTGDLVDPKSLYYGAIYEVEVWLKYNAGPAKGTIRRKLDLVAKCHPKKEPSANTEQHLTSSQERLFEADRDFIAHETVVQDMCTYLRRKGIHNPEELLSLPVR